MNELYAWFHDDITWCINECENLACKRNLANRLQKTGPFTASMFKDTEYCPLFNKENKEDEQQGFVNK